MLRIKLIKSPIGNNWRNRRTVQALGLRKIHQVVEQPDNSSIRGMIHHVQHLVTFEVVEGEVAAKAGKAKKEIKIEKTPKSAEPKAPKVAASKSKPAEKPVKAAKATPKKAAPKAAAKKEAKA